VIIEGEAIEKIKDETLDDIVSESDFIPQNTKEHMEKLKQEIDVFSTKSNTYNWEKKSRSSLIRPDEEEDFNSKLGNFFEEEETLNEWFKEKIAEDEE
jgi:hypothetical protein